MSKFKNWKLLNFIFGFLLQFKLWYDDKIVTTEAGKWNQWVLLQNLLNDFLENKNASYWMYFKEKPKHTVTHVQFMQRIQIEE